MKIFLFLIITFFTFDVLALDITAQNTPVYKKIDISYEVQNINQAIENKDRFAKVKHFVRLFHNQSHDKLWLKIPLVNKSDKAINRVFISRWERVDFTLYTVKDNKVISSETILADRYLKKSSTILIPANSTIDFYVHVKSKNELDQFFYIYFTDSEYANEFIIAKEKFFHYGLFFGILLTMTIYSFFMYFSIKDMGYLFLGFYQISVLIATSDLRQYLFVLLENMPNLADALLRGIFEYIIMILSILFTKEFLNTKEEMPKFNIFLNILMIFLLPVYLIDSNVNYASFLYIIYVFTGIYVFIRTKNLLVLLYALGFLGFPLYLIKLNFVILFDWDFYFDYHDAKQVFTCIESFALTLALYFKIRLLVKEKEKAKEDVIKNEKLMLEQSRFASMGEMIASIAHQWRQPLNHLNIIMANLQLCFDAGKLNKAYLEKKSEEADKQLKYMSSTVENFSTFFATKDKKEEFQLSGICEYTLNLVESRLKKNNILVLLTVKEKKLHVNYKNELIQVLSIVLNNAIDALIHDNTQKREIELVVNSHSIEVRDNAGGIPSDILHKIFDPYFSTKDKKLGTGLGLYTSKIIVDSIVKGNIKVKNIKNGASFTISIF